MLQRGTHCSSPAGEQPPAAPGGGAPDTGSLLASLGLWGLWAGLAAYAFLVAPNQTPLRDAYFLEKLVGLVRGVEMWHLRKELGEGNLRDCQLQDQPSRNVGRSTKLASAALQTA